MVEAAADLQQETGFLFFRNSNMPHTCMSCISNSIIIHTLPMQHQHVINNLKLFNDIGNIIHEMAHYNFPLWLFIK